MYCCVAVVFLSILASSVCSGVEQLKFPAGFKWGAATAAYQVEGAWNVSDKSASICDVFSHTQTHLIADRSNGDVACDSYNQWERDIEIAKELGLNFYRFSIAWSRLLPSGFPDHVSEDGSAYYRRLIEGLLQQGIEPVPTLYHWDLPQKLQDMGGWANPLISDWFADYARVVFSLYGDKVKTWITINEPIIICGVGYGTVFVAPGLNDPLVARFLCDKNVVMAHAKAYRVYEKEFKAKFNGKVSFSNQLVWYEASSPETEAVTELIRQFSYGIYCHPIYSKEGGWPPAVEKQLAENSKRQGYPRSRLPIFTQEEKDMARGTYDFFGVNHYTSRVVRRAGEGEPSKLFGGNSEFNVTYDVRPHWEKAASFWFSINPEGLREVLRWLKYNYGDLEILITENGYSGGTNNLNDPNRVKYYQDYLKQVLLAIKEDGVNVTGYTAWTLIDNFEWLEGYTRTFGLYQVDFTSPGRERTPRLSASFYRRVVQTNSLDVAVGKEEL